MSTMLERYEEACKLLRRCRTALGRSGWEEGETDNDVIDAVNDFLDTEELDNELGGMLVPSVKRPATGRTIPDLRKREHVCEFQRAVTTTSPAPAGERDER